MKYLRTDRMTAKRHSIMEQMSTERHRTNHKNISSIYLHNQS